MDGQMKSSNLHNHVYHLLHQNSKGFTAFFIAFYIVGIIGLAVPLTFPWFTKLIPLALLLSFLVLMAFHSWQSVLKTTSIFLLIYVIGFVVEAIGVNTGFIFGKYHYGSSLGPKILETPLMIGLNWLLLVYLTASTTEKWAVNNLLKVIAAACLMVIYDFILEPVAPHLGMWHWEMDTVPFQNYVAWFFIAFGLQYLLKRFDIKTHNKLAATILICQFAFFLSLFVIFKLRF